MLVFGLTGGIGSGKSTACHFFQELGVPIISADTIAKELTQEPTILDTIETHFGSEIIDSSGQLDRKKLANIIFSSTEEKQWLEDLLHPKIRNKIKKKIAALDTSYCIIEIPLLAESVDHYDFLNGIITVESSLKNQASRVALRDNKTEAEITNIISQQADNHSRKLIANHALDNNGTLEELKFQVSKLHKTIILGF